MTLPENRRTESQIIEDTRQWLEQMVIGLNLCPFARKPYAAGQVNLSVSQAVTEQALLQRLQEECLWLASQPPSRTETTLLVVPWMLEDFLDYNDFLFAANTLLEQCGWEGQLQIASFHPRYQFAGTAPEAAENYSNRSPYPVLHLLREDSLEAAIASYPSPEKIPERNIAALEGMGQPVLAALLAECQRGSGEA